MLKKWWWAVKVFLFPHLERRHRNIEAAKERRRQRASRMSAADDMLATAIMDLNAALQHIHCEKENKK